MSGLGEAWSAGLKSLAYHKQYFKYSHISINTSWQGCRLRNLGELHFWIWLGQSYSYNWIIIELNNIIMIFKSELGEAWGVVLKSLVDHQQSLIYKSTTIKTSWPARTAASSKDWRIRAFCIGITTMGKLDCPIKTSNKLSCVWSF
jgi:hypothetical protein